MNKKEKHILLFSPVDISNGNSGNVQDIKGRVQILEELGYSITIIQCIFNNSAFFKEKNSQRRIINVPKFYQFFSILQLSKRRNQIKSNQNVILESKKIIKEVDPDILWFEYHKFVSLAEELQREFPDKKIYIRLHNYEFGHRVEKLFTLQWISNIFGVVYLIRDIFITKKLEARVFKVADKIFCISKLDVEKYSLRFANKKIIYLPFFNEYKSFYKVRDVTTALNVLYLGGDLAYSFNLEGLCNTINISKKINKNQIVFHILGENMKSSISLPENVIFHGFIENLDDFLKDMDIAIIPVKYGYGIRVKAYELLKRGFPVIVSSRIDQVFGGIAGKDYIVAQGIQEWIKGILYFQNPENRYRFSKNAKMFIHKNFSKESVARILLKEL